MTIIKSISARSFKSFARKTELVFGNKFNCILGPNGSGKSNIADLICFVLGKSSAKSMRAERSANLIYNGGKLGSPAKEAEAEIIFSNVNKEFPLSEEEIKISRVVRQNGNSIYKLNSKTVNRQEIVDLLNSASIDPDGYNIVMQGDIVRFMEMKPVERRMLIEEVSGISVYEDKKQKALNELDKVEGKIAEAEIILKERDTNLKELKKDKDAALRYRELEQTVKDNKATYAHLQIKDKEENISELDKKINENQGQIDSIQKLVDELKTNISSYKDEIKKINEELSKRGEQVGLIKDIENVKTGLVRQTGRLEVCQSELSRIRARRDQLKKNVSELDQKVNELNKKKLSLIKDKERLEGEEKKVSKELEEFKIKYGGNIEIAKLDEGIEKRREEILNLSKKKQELVGKKSQLEGKLSFINDVLGNSSDAKDTSVLKRNFKEVVTVLGKSQDRDAAFSMQLSKVRRDLVVANEELARLNIRSMSAMETISQNVAVKKILEMKKKGVHGIVFSLAEVGKEYATAMAIAAGHRLNAIVVDDDKIAADCIRYLKDNKFGSAIFLPLNKVRGRSEDVGSLLGKEGVYGLATKLIKFDPVYKNVFDYVFGSTLVVKDVEIARRLGIGNARMVTLDGDLMESSGAMIGGHIRKVTSGFKEKDAGADIEKLDKEVNRLKDLIDVIEKNKIENEEAIYRLKEKKAEIEAEIIKSERLTGGKDLEKLKKDRIEIVNEIKTVKLEDLDQDLESYEKEIELFKAKKQKLITEGGNSGESEIEVRRTKIRDSIVNTNGEIKNIDVQINTLLLPEKEKTIASLRQTDKDEESFLKEVEGLKVFLNTQKNALKEKERINKEFYDKAQGAVNKREKLNNNIQNKENNLVREEERIRTIQGRINSLNLDRARFTAEKAGLDKEMEMYVGGKIRRGITLDELKFEISKSEKELQALGNVNLKALEICEELEKELKELVVKKETLKVEKEDVFKMMQEIESKKKDLFMKTFKVIDSNFRRIFVNLSTKGDAFLEIEDAENLFETGVDIKVRIIGNKFLDIRSLSGGEKTMAALSFIFAMQEYNPSSFYMFDEVDASLDKTNSELLSRLILQYANKAQYIVISHNDSIISGADQIYGVSMQKGISQVVSLKI